MLSRISTVRLKKGSSAERLLIWGINHGGPNHLWFHGGGLGEEYSANSENPDAISTHELAAALAQRKDGSRNVNLLFDACFGGSFVDFFVDHLKDSGVKADRFPSIFSTVQRGELSYVGGEGVIFPEYSLFMAKMLGRGSSGKKRFTYEQFRAVNEQMIKGHLFPDDGVYRQQSARAVMPIDPKFFSDFVGSLDRNSTANQSYSMHVSDGLGKKTITVPFPDVTLPVLDYAMLAGNNHLDPSGVDLTPQRMNLSDFSQSQAFTEPRLMDALEAREVFQRLAYDLARAGRGVPGLVRMNVSSGKILIGISDRTYQEDPGLSHNSLLQGTGFRLNSAEGSSEWISMQLYWGEDGFLSRIVLSSPSVASPRDIANGYSLGMRNFLGRPDLPDDLSNESYQKAIHNEIVGIARLISDSIPENRQVEVLFSAITFPELSETHVDVRVLAELDLSDVHTNTPVQAMLGMHSEQQRLLAQGRPFVESELITVRLPHGVHTRPAAWIVQVVNQHKSDGIFVQLVLANGIVLNAGSILYLMNAGITSGSMLKIRVLSAKDNEKARDIIRQVESILTADNSMSAFMLRGGIDFNANKLDLKTQNAGSGLDFHIDPAQLQQLQNATGFSPMIIGIQPINSLGSFLGLKENPVVGIKSG